MDTFKGQDNKVIMNLCKKNFYHVAFIPHNLTNKFQTLDITVTKPTEWFIGKKYNVWFADEVTKQLVKSTEPADVTKYGTGWCYKVRNRLMLQSIVTSLWPQTTKCAMVSIPKLLRIASQLQRLLRLSSLPVYPVCPFRSSKDRKSFHLKLVIWFVKFLLG